MSAIAQMTDMIRGVSEASREQAATVEELSGTVNTLDKATQRNASMATGSAEAAGDLAREVERLSDLVTFFRRSDRGGQRRAA